ncbi:MAG TPA: RNA 2',3'-cyclic phosphodiesterase [Phycisphaerales bacterium]|nr:RNA 2',3'-cyclic phosphodiesterase [Phycisphaerales bacterium]
MRCFIAVDIDEQIAAAVRRVQDDLRRNSCLRESDVRWVDPSLMHITLKFFAEVPDRDIMQICKTITEIAAKCQPFTMNIEKVGTFGSPARVIWVGAANDKPLVELQNDLDGRLAMAGFAAENRKFSVHLTLCRIKNRQTASVLTKLVANITETDFGPLYIDSLCLYKSDLTSQGPEYTLMHRASLS